MNPRENIKKILSIIIALFLGNYLLIILCRIFGKQLLALIPNENYRSFAIQAVSAVLTVLCMFIFKKTGVIRFNAKVLKEGFFSSLVLIIIYSLLLFFGLSKIPGKDLIPASEIICCIMNWILIGVAEEGLFRGVIYELFSDIFGKTTRKGVMLTLTASSVLFGLCHLTNLFAPGISYPMVAIQVATATATGLMFGAIRFRSYGSILPSVFVHALIDASGFIWGGMLWGGTEVDSVNSLDIRSLAMIPILAGTAFYLMRKSKTDVLIREKERTAA